MILGIRSEVKNGVVVRQGLEDLTGEFLKVGRLRLYRLAVAVRARATKAPRRWRGHWTPATVKQARYVHFLYSKTKNHEPLATNPYTRTEAYKKSFKIVKTDFGYVLTAGGYDIAMSSVRVGAPYVEFVGGDEAGQQQSFMHRGRWLIIAEIIAEEEKKLPEALRKDMGLAAARVGMNWKPQGQV